MVNLTTEPIDEAEVLREVRTPAAGAIVLFLGTTREFTGPKQTTRLAYECYSRMAAEKLAELEQQVCEKWPILKCRIVHRLGEVPLAETSVAIAVSAAHRTAAFEAGQWLIDTLKQVVPIWKQEQWADGGTEWVHPGLTT